MTLYLLLSGLIGALIGAFMALGINWATRRIATVEHLLALVHPLGFTLRQEKDSTRIDSLMYAHFPALWSAQAALRAILPWWQRDGLDQAWQRYIFADWYDQISPHDRIADYDATKLFDLKPHWTKDEAVARSAEFIGYLLRLRGRWWAPLRGRTGSRG